MSEYNKFDEKIETWFGGVVRILKRDSGPIDIFGARQGDGYTGSVDDYAKETKSGLPFESSNVLKTKGYLKDLKYKSSAIATQCPSANSMVAFLDKIYLSKIDCVVSLVNNQKDNGFKYWDVDFVKSQGAPYVKSTGSNEFLCSNLYKYKIDKLQPFNGTNNIMTANFTITPYRPSKIAELVQNNPNVKNKNKDKYKLENLKRSKTVAFYWYTNWPDGGIPETKSEKDALEMLVMNLALSHKKPLVHCIAGLGRTGTVLGCFDSLKWKSKVDPVRVVSEMRKHRGVVQSEEQFEYICQFILRNRMAMDINWTDRITKDNFKSYFSNSVSEYLTFKADKIGRFGGVALFQKNLIPDYDDLPGLFDFVDHNFIRNVVILGDGGGFIKFFNSLENAISDYTIHTEILYRSDKDSRQSWRCTIKKRNGKRPINVNFHYFNNFDSNGYIQYGFDGTFDEFIYDIYTSAKQNNMTPILSISKNVNLLNTFSGHLSYILDGDKQYVDGQLIIPHNNGKGKVLPHYGSFHKKPETKKPSPEEQSWNASASTLSVQEYFPLSANEKLFRSKSTINKNNLPDLFKNIVEKPIFHVVLFGDFAKFTDFLLHSCKKYDKIGNYTFSSNKTFLTICKSIKFWKTFFYPPNYPLNGKSLCVSFYHFNINSKSNVEDLKEEFTELVSLIRAKKGSILSISKDDKYTNELYKYLKPTPSEPLDMKEAFYQKANAFQKNNNDKKQKTIDFEKEQRVQINKNKPSHKKLN